MHGRHRPCPHCVRCSPSPIFSPSLLWPSGWMDQDGTWQGGGPWSRPHCGRWGPSSFPKKDIAPNFRSIAIVVKRHGCIKMPLGMEIGLSPGDFVLDGGPAPLPKGGGSPNFRFMSIVAKRAGWIKVPLGTEVGLGPDDIVLDGDSAAPRKWHSSPHLFGACLLWPRSPISATAELFFVLFIHCRM